MKGKIIGFSICVLLIALVLPTSIADVEPLTTSLDDVEINIYAGFLGKDIGLGISIDILSHKTENVTVFCNVTFDFLVRNHLDFTHESNITVPPETPCLIHIGSPDGIKFISITAEAEDTIVSRSGLSIRRLVILSNEYIPYQL